MRIGLATAALAAVAAAAPIAAAAQEQRPSEDELFGAPPKQEAAPSRAEPAKPTSPPPTSAPPPPSGAPDARKDAEAELFGSSGSPNAVPPPPQGIITREKEDPLRIGGMLYLRGFTSWQDGVAPRNWSLSSPSLVDLFVDVRPNDRVRGFALARTTYDPTLDGAQEVPVPPALLQLFGLPTQGQNPHGVLDQLWLNFDSGRRVFFTAGRQHVKWGVGRFWNPTDWLHTQRRDPLAVFDPRAGTNMVKVHVPWEARGWNAYAYAVLDDTGPAPVATQRLGRVGAAARAEVVLGTFELGLDTLVREGRKPRFGVDGSLGVGDFDLHAEAALRTGADVDRWRRNTAAESPARPVVLEKIVYSGLTPQIVAGATWSAKYSDEDSVTVGAEYSFDDTGYSNARIYPLLLAVPFLFPSEPSPFVPFYLGKHQAALSVTLPQPGSWNNTTVTLSGVANLSDGSVVVRLDHSVLVLTYLRLETFVAGHAGTRGGELRFALDVDPRDYGINIPGVGRVVRPPPILDLGIALRVSL
ncbi:MAG TPA: hypothetical protein VFK90_05050 [Anaeromyxobacter sp.]|nr:hypothetical protein [Anaeromyxobacter sp.]